MSNIVNINGGDIVKNSRQVINDNFDALNNDKLEISDYNNDIAGIQNQINLKADANNVYTKVESNNLLSFKADITYVDLQNIILDNKIDLQDGILQDQIDDFNTLVDNLNITKADVTYVDNVKALLNSNLNNHILDLFNPHEVNLIQLLDVTISDPLNNQSLTYDNGQWVNKFLPGSGDVQSPNTSLDNTIVLFDGASGKIIKDSNITIDTNGNIGNINGFKFNVSPIIPSYSAGNLYYDALNNTLAFQTGIGNTTLQLGQENYIKVCKNTGGDLLNGTIVYISGANNILGFPTVEKADPKNYDTSRIIGVLTMDIPSGECGLVTSFGEVNDLDTSSYTAGQTVYLSPTNPGEFTATQPTGGYFVVMVGIVTKVDATTGKILVYPRAQDYTNEVMAELGWSSNIPTLSWDDASRTISLNATEFHHYQNGVKYSKTTDSFQISATEGLHYVYYNLGVLTEIVNPTNAQVDSIIRNYPTVSQIYWDASNNRADYYANELHQFGMNPLVHSYLHFLFRMRYTTGLALNTITSDASGNLNTSAQFGTDSGAVNDEDIYLPIPAILSTLGLPISYLAGTTTNPTLRVAYNTGYSVLTTGTGRLAFNTISAGNYILQEVTNTNFVLCHVIANNHNTSTKRLSAFMGQNQYTTLANARAGAQTELTTLKTVGILPQESKAIATLIFETNNTYTNAVKARIRSISTGVDYVDWRTTYFNGSNAGGAGGGSGSSVFSDSTFQIFDNVDPTKKMMFETANITTGTTRTLTIPDRDITLDNITTSTTTNGTGFLKGNGSAISFDNSTYLTSVGTGTPNQITYWSGANTLGSLTTATYPSLTELSYVKGVTSSIQTQLNGKLTASGTDRQLAFFTGTSTQSSDAGLVYETRKTLTLLDDYGNMGIGSGALLNRTSNSYDNTCVGKYAGRCISDANSCVFVGSYSGNNSAGNFTGQSMTGIGTSSLSSITGSGDGNTAVGASSGNALTTGQRNSFFGFSSGNNMTTGLYNSCFGYMVGSTITSIGSYNLYLGAGTISTYSESNTIRIANAYDPYKYTHIEGLYGASVHPSQVQNLELCKMGVMSNGRLVGIYSHLETDFTRGTNDFTSGALSGGAIAVVTPELNHPGINSLSSVATANSGYRVLSDVSYIKTPGLTYECIFKTPSSINASNIFRAGFASVFTVATINDGFYIELSNTTLTPKAAAGGFVSTNGTYSVSTNTWYNLKIVVAGDGASANYYLYDSSGTLLFNLNLTPPTTQAAMAAGACGYNTAGTANVVIYLDKISAYILGKQTR